MRGSIPILSAASRRSRSTTTFGRTLPSLITKTNLSRFCSSKADGFMTLSLLINDGMHRRTSLHLLMLLLVGALSHEIVLREFVKYNELVTIHARFCVVPRIIASPYEITHSQTFLVVNLSTLSQVL